jgi:cytoplasmic iron level regulating protein YaaA (DUF328/UPF0246 family)
MLILLPPSEKKKAATGQDQFNLAKLSFPEALSKARSVGLPNFDQSKTAAAIDVYAGVLYQGLDWDSLSDLVKIRANEQVLIISALFGLVKPLDQIFGYKLKIDNKLWREPISEVAEGYGDELIIDCRSSTYKGVWPIKPDFTIDIRVFSVAGAERLVITHMSKKYRGELARHLLSHPSNPKTPKDVHQIAAGLFECELHPPTIGQPWALDLLIS